MIHVGIVDDHPEMRVVLALLVKMSEDTELVCEGSNGQEAVDCVKQLQPDVLVMDIHMPVLNGLEATSQIIDLALRTRVILISTERGNFILRQAMAAGAHGFVPKDALVTSLPAAIKAVHRGELFLME
jgi:DNA-binding NarL/FixJ family response regulator